MSALIPSKPAQSWSVDQRTGCYYWTGRFSKKSGRPVDYDQGQQTPASRKLWCWVFGAPPHGTGLIRLCSDVRCVSPYHHVVRSPETSIRRAGLRRTSLTMIRQLIVSAVAAEPALRMVWDAPLGGLECDPIAIQRLAASVPGLPPFALLCGYASLALKASHKRAQNAAPDVSDVVESRLMMKLAELGQLGESHE